MSTHVVVLVPGFFGFSRFNTFYYFADRVSAAIRVRLESRLTARIVVAPASSWAAHSLVERQKELLQMLAKLDRRFNGDVHFHLVGHSTGGVDAELLTRERNLSREPWTPDEAALRKKIRSVVTVASPHYGTGLVEDPAIVDFARPWLPIGPNLLAELPRLALPLFTEARGNGFFAEAIAGVVGSPIDSLSYLKDLLHHRELTTDLRPSRMKEVQDTHPSRINVPVTCFVTVTPPLRQKKLRERTFFDLFKEKTERSLRDPGDTPREVVESEKRLAEAKQEQVPVINGTGKEIELSSNASDGVVNSARQLVPHGTLGAIVVADHLDVIGQYDREDIVRGRDILYGAFRSGANFRDDQFFQLYSMVGDRIYEAIQASVSGMTIALPPGTGGRKRGRAQAP